MYNAIIGNTDLKELGIYVKSINIGSAEPKTMTVDVPYANGTLDLTDYYGSVRYKKRKIQIDCLIIDDVPRIYSELCNAINGQKLNITCTNDPEYYYVGRVSVGSARTSNAASVKITAECEPYKVKSATGAKSL